MSHPTQEQPSHGAPAQPYGAPAPQPNGVPTQPTSATQTDSYTQTDGDTQTYGDTQKNGLATAGLVLGILPTGIIGLVVSIFGIVRAKKVGGTGRARAWVGAVLSVLWLAASIALVSTAGSTVSERLNPGCAAAEAYVPTWETKMQSDGADAGAIKVDLQSAITELNKDAAKSTDATATNAIKELAGDIHQLLGNLNAGTSPSDALLSRMDSDGSAIDAACGR